MAKEHPFDFKKWDAFLAEIEGKEIPWVMGAVADGHPQYDERMIELAKAFEQLRSYVEAKGTPRVA